MELASYNQNGWPLPLVLTSMDVFHKHCTHILSLAEAHIGKIYNLECIVH